MHRSPALLTIGIVLGAGACSHDRPSGPDSAPTSQTTSDAGTSTTRQTQNGALRRAAFELARAEHRWSEPWPKPERWQEQKCPKGLLGGHPTSGKRLAVRIQDDRWEKRDLLPLELTTALASREVVDARAILERQQVGGVKQDQLQAVLGELARFQQMPYAAVFHLVQYEPPKVVRKVDRIRPEWIPGVVNAWLAIHDAEESDVRCQVHVVARNSVQDAPLSRRLRPTVQARLEKELIAQTWDRARERLGFITDELEVRPPSQLEPVREVEPRAPARANRGSGALPIAAR